MTAYTRNQIVELLTANECKISYTKVTTGEAATMRCTLRADVVPATSVTESADATADTVEAVLPVYNTELKAWRSFRVGNVNSIEVV